MTPFDRAERLRQLHSELDKTLGDFIETQKELDRIILESQNWMPEPDGNQNIINAGKASRQAFVRYQQALKRLSDFWDSTPSA